MCNKCRFIDGSCLFSSLSKGEATEHIPFFLGAFIVVESECIPVVY